MKIKNVEERTGLSRSNVRFYEKEKLIEPSRNESNGYRDYSENDVENIKKIAYLRTLGISIEDIRSIISGKVTLQETLERQNEILNSQITDLNKAKRMCEKMLGEESISYEKLQVEQYVTELQKRFLGIILESVQFRRFMAIKNVYLLEDIPLEYPLKLQMKRKLLVLLRS